MYVRIHIECTIVRLDGIDDLMCCIPSLSSSTLSQILTAAMQVDMANGTAQSDLASAQDLGNRTEQRVASLQAQSQQLAVRASRLCAGSQQTQQVGM